LAASAASASSRASSAILVGNGQRARQSKPIYVLRGFANFTGAQQMRAGQREHPRANPIRSTLGFAFGLFDGFPIRLT